MMKFQRHTGTKNEIINAEETRRFSGSLVMPETNCCLCCPNHTGGDTFCM